MKRTATHDVIQIPRGVWETAETKEDLEDWLLAHSPRIIRNLRRIRRHEDLAGRGKTLDELARQWVATRDEEERSAVGDCGA